YHNITISNIPISIGQRSFLKQTIASTHPFLILIVSDSNHLSLAETAQVVGRNGPRRSILPEVENAYLALSRHIRSRNSIGIFYLTLQDPVLRVVYLVDIVLRDVDHDALAGEGEQRLQDIILEIGGRLLYFVKEKCLRHIGMPYKRQRVLADPVEPIRMRYPL